MTRLGAEAIAFGGAVRKEWRILARYPGNIIALLATAVLVPGVYLLQASGFSADSPSAIEAFGQRSGTTQVAGFIYLGWAVYLWISLMLWGPGMALRRERVQGSLETVYLSPASKFTVLFAPAVVQLVPAVLLFTVVGLMMRFAFGVPIGAAGLFSGLLVIVASIPVLFAIGALMGVVVMGFRDAEGIIGALRGLLAILCGVTFPVAVLPEWVRPISLALPPTQILDTLRIAVLRPAALHDTTRRILLLIGAGVVIGALALALLGLVLRAATRSGRLGQY